MNIENLNETTKNTNVQSLDYNQVFAGRSLGRSPPLPERRHSVDTVEIKNDIRARIVPERKEQQSPALTACQGAVSRGRKCIVSESKKRKGTPSGSMHEEASGIVARLTDFVGDPAKKINKNNRGHIKDEINKLLEMIQDLENTVTDFMMGESRSPPAKSSRHENVQETPEDDEVTRRMERIIMSDYFMKTIAKVVLNIMKTEATDATDESQRPEESVDALTTARQPDRNKVGFPKHARRIARSRSLDQDEPPSEEITPASASHSEGEFQEVVNKRNHQRKQTKETILKKLEDNPPTKPRAGETALVITSEVNGARSYSGALKALESMVDPSTLGTTIRGVRATKSGNVIIKTATKEDAEKLQAELEKVKEPGLSWRTSHPRNPRVVLTGIPRSWEANELAGKLKGKLGPEDASIIMRPLFRRGPKEAGTIQWVAEVDPGTRKLLKNKIITIGWLSIRTHDYIEQPRCYRCQAFGHIVKNCPTKTETCSWCSNNGHTIKECPNKKQPAKCINCNIIGIRKNTDHPTFDQTCTAYLRFIQKRVNNTYYG